MASEEKVPWVALCPTCSARRFLWPPTQNVNTGREPHARWIHFNGKKECST